MTEELVAMPVEREPLEEPADVEDSVAPPLEHFHAVVETPNQPTRLPTLEVIRDLGRLSIDHPKKAFERKHSLFFRRPIPSFYVRYEREE